MVGMSGAIVVYVIYMGHGGGSGLRLWGQQERVNRGRGFRDDLVNQAAHTLLRKHSINIAYHAMRRR
jgi:hypothetical protein